jgi:hypothetical protein
MTDATIPDDLKEFIFRNLDTIAQLEALLLLHRDPRAKWDVRSLAKRLYIGERETDEILKRLAAAQLVDGEGETYHFNDGFEQKQMLDRLTEAYSKQLISVTRLIHAKPSRIREFADAFRLRRDS